MTRTDEKRTVLLTDGLYVFAAVLVTSLVLFALFALLSPSKASTSAYSIGVIHRTNIAVATAQACQRHLDQDRRPDQSRHLYARTDSMAFRHWALRLWRGRAHRCSARTSYLNAYPPRAIEYVFDRISQTATALIVAQREGGGGYCTRATNGQYLGCYQMGDWARSRYGHGPTALDQSWAAFWYVRDARGWCSGWAATAPGC